MCVSVHMCACHSVHGEVREQLAAVSSPLLPRWVLGNQTQVIRLNGKHLYSLSLIGDPNYRFLNFSYFDPSGTNIQNYIIFLETET